MIIVWISSTTYLRKKKNSFHNLEKSPSIEQEEIANLSMHLKILIVA